MSDDLAAFAVEPEALGPEQHDRIDRHLEHCAVCRAEVEIVSAALAAGEDGTERVIAPPATRAWPRRLAIAAGLILAFGLGFSALVRSPAEDHVVNARELTGSQVIEAEGSIRASGVAIPDGGEVQFRAGESVALGEGFVVGSSASLTIEVGEIATTTDWDSS